MSHAGLEMRRWTPKGSCGRRKPLTAFTAKWFIQSWGRLQLNADTDPLVRGDRFVSLWNFKKLQKLL
jgi:hypothetical protein